MIVDEFFVVGVVEMGIMELTETNIATVMSTAELMGQLGRKLVIDSSPCCLNSHVTADFDDAFEGGERPPFLNLTGRQALTDT